jgi:hypothetical protein
MPDKMEIGVYHPAFMESEIKLSDDDLRRALDDSMVMTQIIAVACHEWDHFLQSILTSFGRYLTWTIRAEVFNAFAVAKHLLSEGNKILIPIFRNYSKIKDQEIKEKLYHLVRLLQIRNLLYGEQSLTDLLPVDFYGAIPKRLPNPVYISRSRKLVLSARQIIEGHARAWELSMFLAKTYQHHFNTDEVTSLLSGLYWDDPYPPFLNLCLKSSIRLHYMV